MSELDKETLAVLDPGIREVVAFLNAFGIETYESCEGGAGHCYPEPTVRFHGGPGEGFRAFGLLRQVDAPMYSLRRIWQILDGEPTGPHWEIVFGERIKAQDWRDSYAWNDSHRSDAWGGNAVLTESAT